MTSTAAEPATSATSALVAGLDLLTSRERDADHHALRIAAELADRGLRDITVATHWAQVGNLRHVALSIQAGGDPGSLWDVLTRSASAAGAAGTGLLLSDHYRGEPELRDTLTAAVAAHANRTSGRAVVFPGSAAVTGTLSVGEALDRSVIDRVDVLAGGPADAAARLVTRDFVRPRWTGGALVLDVQPAVGGTLVPFETPTPTPCCPQHSG